MATIETTTNTNQLRFPSVRRIDRQTRTGHLFYISWGSGIIQVYRSTNNGASWSTFGGQRAAVTTIVEMGSLHVDWQNRLYFTYRVNVSSQDRVYMQAAVITTTGPSWHTPLLVASAGNGGVAGSALSGSAITVVRHNNGNSTGAVGVGFNGASVGVTLYGFTIPAIGQPVLNNSVVANRRSWTATGSATGRVTPAMGYELSPAHMWVTFGRTYLYAVKCTWNGAGWTAPSSAVRITPGTIGVSPTPIAQESCASIWRNPGWVVAQPTPEDPTTILLSERNQANSFTTYKVSLTHPTGSIRHCAIALNNQNGNVRIYAVGQTNGLYYCDYIASSGTFTSWATVIGPSLDFDDEFSVRRENYQSANFDVLTLISAGSPPWTVGHTAQKATYAPFVPTWNEGVMGRTNGSAADVAASLLLQWTFSDPDAGDTQSAWALSRQIGTGTIQYLRASDSTWQATEQKNILSTTSRTLAAGWGVDGDPAHTYQVKVWDASDTASNYSVGFVILPSAKANPTLTLAAPTDINPTLDTGFESGLAGWTGFNATVTQSSAFAHTGTKSAKLVSNAATSPKVTRSANDPVTVGVQYTFDAWLYAPVALPQQAYVGIQWWNGTTFVVSDFTLVTMPVGVWTKVTVTATAPGGITGMRREAGISGSAPAGLELYVDDAVMLSPWGGTINTDTVVATWTVAEMTAYRITLSTNPGGEVVHDSGWRAASDDTSYEIPYRLPDGTTWTVGLQTRNNEGLPSNLATAGFFVDYIEPPTPTCTLTPLPSKGVIRVAIDNPTPGVGQPDLAEQALYRRPRLYTNLLPNPGFEVADGGGTGSGWVSVDGTGARTTAQAHTGSWSWSVTPNGTGLFPRADGPYVALTGVMRVGGWIRAQAGTSPLQIAVHAFDGAGGYLTTRGQRRVTAAVGQWVYLSTTADFGDLPTAVLCTVTLGRGDGLTAPPAGDIFQADDAWVSPADPYDGAVVAAGVITDSGAQETIALDGFTRTVSNGLGTPDFIALPIPEIPDAAVDPTFETGISTWSVPVNNSVVQTTEQVYSGTFAAKMVTTGVSNNPYIRAVTATPVAVGVQYTLSAWVYSAVATNVYIDLEWFSSSNTPVSESPATVAVAANTWTMLTVTGTAPAGAAGVKRSVGLSGFSIPSARVLYIDSVLLAEGVTAASKNTSTWVVSGGPASAFSVNGSVGQIAIGAVATGYRAVIPSAQNVDIVSTFVVPVIPTGAGGSIICGLLARYTDTSNFYLGEMLVNPDLTIQARIRKSVGGTFTTVLTSSAIAGLTHSTGKTYRVRFVVQGTSLRVRVWDNATVEPSVWHLDIVDISLNPINGQIGFRVAVDTGNTNTLPVNVTVDSLLVQGVGGGGSSAATVEDWYPVSGIEYEYQVLARASNGTSAASPWTA